MRVGRAEASLYRSRWRHSGRARSPSSSRRARTRSLHYTIRASIIHNAVALVATYAGYISDVTALNHSASSGLHVDLEEFTVRWSLRQFLFDYFRHGFRVMVIISAHWLQTPITYLNPNFTTTIWTITSQGEMFWASCKTLALQSGQTYLLWTHHIKIILLIKFHYFFP